jgi:nickel-dependent lactate racemase
MPEVKIPWGSGELSVSIPEHWKLQQVAEPALRAAPENWPERLAAAIHHPVAGPSLARLLADNAGKRISIIVEDHTRHSPLERILGVVLKEIRHAGIDPAKLEFVFASGMHPPMTLAQAADKLGSAAAGIPWRCNPWDDPKAYVDLGRVGNRPVRIDRGVVDSDLRIIISSVSPHLQAGFGGGYKMLFPGCGELASIRGLHRFGIRRRNQGQMVGTDATQNPMRAAIDAAGAMVDACHGTTFTVQYLLDADDQPVAMAAGEPAPTHQMVSKQCSVACGVVSEMLADVLLTNAYPRDYDLWQSFKCIPNTCWAARPGGVVICLARCPAGLNEMKTMPWPLSPLWTRKVVRAIGPETICSLMDRIVTQLAGDSQWFIRLATQILQRNHLFMVSPNLVEAGVKFPGIALFATAEKAMAAAEKLLGYGGQRVAVYPSGGTSFPVLTTPKRDSQNG